MSEAFAYRDNLQAILEFTNGRHLLFVGEVLKYLGLSDTRVVRKHFPIKDNYISAETLARCLAGGECKK